MGRSSLLFISYPQNPLAIWLTAPLHSTLNVARLQLVPLTLSSACWSQPFMQMIKASSFPQPSCLPLPSNTTPELNLNTWAFPGFHFETVQLLPLLSSKPVLFHFRDHCSGTQFSAAGLLPSIFCCCKRLSQADLGGGWFNLAHAFGGWNVQEPRPRICRAAGEGQALLQIIAGKRCVGHAEGEALLYSNPSSPSVLAESWQESLFQEKDLCLSSWLHYFKALPRCCDISKFQTRVLERTNHTQTTAD